ncbi:stomatin-like protein 1 isoform X1 [Cherax quadricarinatus]|uniref:stomatin-like protein 1 isoform X1 n=1 Tax=Cherax quadricarinatus TaxID=27406 RepID=UPI00237874AF|nr:stomatin-like protein 1 isoform X1 [Cherax quadricarinatus]
MVSFAKYSLVPMDEPKETEDITQSRVTGAFDYNSAFSYKSAFDYSKPSSQYQSAFDYGYGHRGHSVSLNLGEKDNEQKKKKFANWSIMNCLATLVTWLSYFFIALTFPITLWFCFKKIAQWERLIVFRLGRLRGALGPGLVFIIPWLDHHTRVDMRTKAFSVPPQQLITADNGIIEMGCEVKYRISDVQRLTISVTSPEHGLRSFGKTVMLNVLTKNTVRETERDRPVIAAQIQKELNLRVLEWGIEIGDVTLSTVNILKEAEPNNPLKPILNCFGGGGGEIMAPPASAASAASGMFNIPGLGNMGDFNFLSGISKKKSEAIDEASYMRNGLHFFTDLLDFSDENSEPPKQLNNQVTSSRSPHSKLGKHLQSLINGAGGADLAHGIYRLQVEGKDGGIFIIFVGNGVRQVVEGDLPKVTPDVAVTIAKSDLMAIFEGTLAPLQAYLSGHLTVQGNVQMLMGLESLRQGNKDKDKDDIFIV